MQVERSRFDSLLSEPDYESKNRAAILLAKECAEKLPKLNERLECLDVQQIEIMSELFRHLAPNFARLPWADILDRIEEHTKLLQVLSVALAISTGTTIRPSGRGRKRLPYAEAAFDLLQLWERYTDKMMKSPKGVAMAGIDKKSGRWQIEAEQTSTEFMRLALKMINPRVKLSEVMTSIKNARQLKQRRPRRPRVALSARYILELLSENLRK